MQKLRRITIFTVIIVAFAVIIALVRPWQYIPGIPALRSGAALTVNSPLGKAEVYLDEKKVGETPYSSENLSPGDYSIEIRRISAAQDFYETISKEIHLEANTRTFVEAEIGPGTQFSSVIIMYYTRNTTDAASVFIDTTPKESLVSIDGMPLGKTPIATDELSPGKHTVAASRVGYEQIEADIITREGYTLITEIQLMAQPIYVPTEQE